VTAYVIAMIEVADPGAYSTYTARTPDVIAQFGGRFVVRGGDPQVLEGTLPGSRVVVIAFPDRGRAEEFYRSNAYQEILPLRLAAATGSLCIVDGAD